MNSNQPNAKDLWCACLATAAILAVFSIANAQPLQVRQKTFDTVWKTVNERYFDPKFGGVDWAGIRKQYEP
jgi:hypothetical protein